MAGVLRGAAYLPAARCFALVAPPCLARRTGNEAGAELDYDGESATVRLTAAAPMRAGEEVRVFDGRPGGEMVLVRGELEDDSSADCLSVRVGLVAADRFYTAKREILESFGFQAVQEFPIFRDRFPNQLLAYLRLSRLQDPALLAKVSFENDVILSPANEYEVLQLLLGECRERLAAYAGTAEEDVKLLQQGSLGPREHLAARLRLAEKRILQGTMDGVRRRLAPIRGIPTKGGDMRDPNADLAEIFTTLEGIPALPSQLLSGVMSWARGEQDPTWKKRKGGGTPKQPLR